MRIQNVDSRNNNGFYEVVVCCKNEQEFDKAIVALRKKGFRLDFMEELEINVYAEAVFDYETKAAFAKHVREVVK